MKTSVKTPVLITILALATCFSHAQLNIIKTSQLGNDIKKVIEDYPNNFSNLKGDIVLQNPQSTEYECNFKVEGAKESSITRYTSKSKSIFSWQALMLSSEDFSEAKKKYQSLFNQVNNLRVKTEAAGYYRISGKYDAPSEEKKFAGSVCAISSGEENLKKLKVEVSLQYEMMEWKVRLLIYDSEREDPERGKTTEN